MSQPNPTNEQIVDLLNDVLRELKDIKSEIAKLTEADQR